MDQNHNAKESTFFQKTLSENERPHQERRPDLIGQVLRGPYGPDELRTPLRSRLNEPWTRFEADLFNLVTRYGDRQRHPFSQRLAIVDAMLETYDAEIAIQRSW